MIWRVWFWALILISFFLPLDLEILQQECTHPAMCTSFPTIVQRIHPTQLHSNTTCIWQLKKENVWTNSFDFDSLSKYAIKKLPFMEVVLLASMRIEVRFDQWPSMNVINYKIIRRFCGKNVFKDPDHDSEGFVSSFVTLEDAMLSLTMSCYYHRLKSVVMSSTNSGNTRTFIRKRLLHPSSIEEEPNFDHIQLWSPDQC